MKVENIRHPSGQIIPIIVDEFGLPLPGPNEWLIHRHHLSENTLKRNARELVVLHRWAKKLNIDVLQRIRSGQGFTEAEISTSLATALRKDYTKGKVVKAAVSPSVQIQRITTCADYLAYQADMAISTMRTVDPQITSIQGAKNRILGWLGDILPTNGSSGPRKESRLTQAQGDFLVALLLKQDDDLDQGSDPALPISTRDRFSLLLMLLCGLRIGELLNLKVPDIDFGSITSLHVRRRPVDPDDPRSVRPLVKRLERTLDVDQGVADIINYYILYDREKVLDAKGRDTEYLIVSRDGEPLSLSRMGKICKALARRFPTKLPKGFSAHSLRHAFSENMERDLRGAGFDEERRRKALALLRGDTSLSSQDVYIQAEINEQAQKQLMENQKRCLERARKYAEMKLIANKKRK